MTSGTSIADEKYLSLTTYKKDGTAKALPVWIYGLDDGRVGFTTSSSSWKVRRLKNDPRVVLQPSDQRGRIVEGSSPVTGTGEVADQATFEQVRAGIKQKYGFGYTMIGVINRVMSLFGENRTSDTAVVITLD